MGGLLEPILNQILPAEMIEHLGAESGERTDDQKGYRNGSHERGGRVRLSDHAGWHNRVGGATGP